MWLLTLYCKVELFVNMNSFTKGVTFARRFVGVSLILLGLASCPVYVLFPSYVGGDVAETGLFGRLFYGIVAIFLWGGIGSWIAGFKSDETSTSTQQSDSENNVSTIQLFISLCASVAKADGKISESEIQTINNFFIDFGADATVLALIEKELRTHENEDINVEYTAHQLSNLIGYEVKYWICSALIDIAEADGNIDSEEINVINRVIDILVTSEEIRTVLKNRLLIRDTDELTKSLKILGLNHDFTSEQLRKRYYSLSKEYHPDRAEKMDNEFKRYAEKKMSEINAAYSYLKNYYGNG